MVITGDQFLGLATIVWADAYIGERFPLAYLGLAAVASTASNQTRKLSALVLAHSRPPSLIGQLHPVHFGVVRTATPSSLAAYWLLREVHVVRSAKHSTAGRALAK